MAPRATPDAWLICLRERHSVAAHVRKHIYLCYCCDNTDARVHPEGIAMENPMVQENSTRMDLANRLFFRLYQCANMLHKTGTKAVEEEGLTTQQWAVLGALSRPNAEAGMCVGDLARYLLFSRQNLSGLISRMERDGHIAIAPDGRDRRARLVTMTESGRHVWNVLARPKIRSYYERALSDFSIGDMAHSLHYLLKLLENMKKLDGEEESSSLDNDPAAQRGAI